MTLPELASALGDDITVGEDCVRCSCPLSYIGHDGFQFCARCYPKPRNNWPDDLWKVLCKLPRTQKEKWVQPPGPAPVVYESFDGPYPPEPRRTYCCGSAWKWDIALSQYVCRSCK